MNKPIRLHLEEFKPLTQEEMAVVLGITKSAVEKLERRLIQKLRTELSKRGVRSEDAQDVLRAFLDLS
jgi:DNA-directed RNA polymerase specialized sigma24 family protein